MPKYIDADALLAQMKDRRFYVGRRSDPVCIVEDAPAADVEPVRRGRWVSKEGVYGVVYCSICDFELKIDNTPYCPCCAAKMDEVSDND